MCVCGLRVVCVCRCPLSAVCVCVRVIREKEYKRFHPTSHLKGPLSSAHHLAPPPAAHPPSLPSPAPECDGDCH